MDWVGFLVLGLVILMLASILWTGLSTHGIKDRSVDSLDSTLPGLAAHKDKAVIYCYSEQCGPCRRMGPDIDRLCQQHPNVFKLDVRKHPRESRAMGIRATPTTLLVEEGKILKAILGAGAIPAVQVFLGHG
jgi:thioredoxin-like negative regulator of GroEL